MAFYGCAGLQGITIPDGVGPIGLYAFSECSLRTVMIIDSVVGIGHAAFGAAYYKVNFVPEGNYAPAFINIRITVNKAVPVITLSDKNAACTGLPVEIDPAVVTFPGGGLFGGTLSYTYYTDYECTELTGNKNGADLPGSAPAKAGTYYVTAAASETENTAEAVSNTAVLVISKVK